MSEETARKICEQMTDDIDDLCNCCRKNEKDRSCIGCRELAIKTILQENTQLKQQIDKANNELITLIQIIMKQPSKNVEEDNYLLSRLEGISKVLKNE